MKNKQIKLVSPESSRDHFYQQVEMMSHRVSIHLALIDTVKQFSKVLVSINTPNNII